MNDEIIETIEYDDNQSLVFSLIDADFGKGSKKYYEITYLTPASKPNSFYSNNSEYYSEARKDEAFIAFEYRKSNEPWKHSPACNFTNKAMFE